jgi:hypothetical protein
MNPVFWAAVLTIFKPGAPGETSSTLLGTHFTNEAVCIASVLKDQPTGSIRTSNGGWIIESCVKVDPNAYLMTDDGEHVTLKPGVNVRSFTKALCAAARKAADKKTEQQCSEAEQ